jgi:tRNA(Glu) U13 pseudouridine synthase TruD
MSKVIAEENKVTIDKAQSDDNIFKTYIEIWSNYFEDFASACYFENEFFKYLVRNTSEYFASLMSFYKNLNQMYMMAYPAWDPSRFLVAVKDPKTRSG